MSLVGAALVGCGSPDAPITQEAPRVELAPERAQGDAEVVLPKPSNGVLPPGSADAILPAGSAPIVRLLEPGAEPRSELSYAITKGDSQRLSMGLDIAVAVKSKGQQGLPQTPIPRLTMAVDTFALERISGGEVRLGSMIASATVDPNSAKQEQMAKALRPQLDLLKGLALSYWMTPKGSVRDSRLDVPPGVPASAAQLVSGMSEGMGSMAVPLPNGAVGVGGRWQVVTRAFRGGTDVLQSSIYRVRSRSGSRATLEVSVVEVAASDAFRMPQMPAGMTVKVKSFEAIGSGSTNLDLKSVVPESGLVTFKRALELSIPTQAGVEDGRLETTTTIQMARP